MGIIWSDHKDLNRLRSYPHGRALISLTRLWIYNTPLSCLDGISTSSSPNAKGAHSVRDCTLTDTLLVEMGLKLLHYEWLSHICCTR